MDIDLAVSEAFRSEPMLSSDFEDVEFLPDSEGCTAILVTGGNAGFQCGKRIIDDETQFCSQHHRLHRQNIQRGKEQIPGEKPILTCTSHDMDKMFKEPSPDADEVAHSHSFRKRRAPSSESMPSEAPSEAESGSRDTIMEELEQHLSDVEAQMMDLAQNISTIRHTLTTLREAPKRQRLDAYSP